MISKAFTSSVLFFLISKLYTENYLLDGNVKAKIFISTRYMLVWTISNLQQPKAKHLSWRLNQGTVNLELRCSFRFCYPLYMGLPLTSLAKYSAFQH